ncbi:MAG: DedA family protein [candidate division WOR-3 bacterium]|nr:MAG: DedA family protein [candidate division WOR-3 bacterium]
MFDWISRQSIIVIYSFLFVNAMFESLCPPYPSDAFVLVFSFLAGRGYCNPYLVYVLTVAGSLAGIMLVYHIGKSHGNRLLAILSHSFLGRLLPVRLIERAKRKFHQRGDIIVLLNRFLPGMRAPIVFAAGIVGIKQHKVFYYSLISALLWNAFLIVAGFYVGATWDQASKFLRNYTVVAALSLIAILLVLTVVYFRRRSLRRGTD